MIDWIFPGENPNKHITERTVQRIFENAQKKAGICKNVSVHSSRHSFQPISWKVELICDISKNY
ncbi:tyrosine-type recombinase/integrase [Desulfosporosinus lacus]|uniref:tyrosine-type recombinase/integrase n=1 Tax=Desulfosporosinus lacus TaxID=329936 RepID=UPI001FA8822D|nr:tyrosine-type recombinase/integrase [Desulfosporosinus lacus]